MARHMVTDSLTPCIHTVHLYALCVCVCVLFGTVRCWDVSSPGSFYRDDTSYRLYLCIKVHDLVCVCMCVLHLCVVFGTVCCWDASSPGSFYRDGTSYRLYRNKWCMYVVCVCAWCLVIVLLCCCVHMHLYPVLPLHRNLRICWVFKKRVYNQDDWQKWMYKLKIVKMRRNDCCGMLKEVT